MFTGIVEELGEVIDTVAVDGSVWLRVRGDVVTEGTELGDSISVNGVCLTVVERSGNSFAADAIAETLAHSTLGRLEPGARVNLERPVTLATRLGGHLVQGHVDATATVLARTPSERWDVVRLSLPTELARYVVYKGSITVDGISLTVSGLGGDWFEVSLIPATLAATTMGAARVGTEVNLEVDVVAKYVEKLLGSGGAAR